MGMDQFHHTGIQYRHCEESEVEEVIQRQDAGGFDVGTERYKQYQP